MPRAKYVKLDRITPANLRAVELFLEHGIVGVRMNAHGQLAWLKHSLFGWVSPQVFSLIQRIERLPWDKVIEGGYRVNAALYSNPVAGPVVIATAIAALLYAWQNELWSLVALIAAGLILPFGALILVYLFADGVGEIIEGIGDEITRRQEGAGLFGFGGFLGLGWWADAFHLNAPENPFGKGGAVEPRFGKHAGRA